MRHWFVQAWDFGDAPVSIIDYRGPPLVLPPGASVVGGTGLADTGAIAVRSAIAITKATIFCIP